MIDFQSSLTGVTGLLANNQTSAAGMSSPGGTRERGERHYICCSNSNERSECRFVCCSGVETGEGELYHRGRQSALIRLRYLRQKFALIRAIRVKVPRLGQANFGLFQPIYAPPPPTPGVARSGCPNPQPFATLRNPSQPYARVFWEKRIVYFLPRRLVRQSPKGNGGSRAKVYQGNLRFHSCPRKRKWGARPSPVVAFGVPAECISLPMPLSPICQPCRPKAGRLDG